MDNDWVGFSARFNGVVREIAVPVSQVQGIFARENGQGMMFPPESGEGPAEPAGAEPEGEPPKPTRPKLQVVK
jgi:stringent starvation protein B